MARAGDEIVNPVTGHRIIFRKTTQDIDGELLQMEWIGRVGWKAGPVHVHSFQEERYEVLSGTLGSHVAGVERIHAAGEVVVAPVGAKHTVWDEGGKEVRALVEFRPASQRSETMLETVFGLAQDGSRPLQEEHPGSEGEHASAASTTRLKGVIVVAAVIIAGLAFLLLRRRSQ